MKQQKKMKLWQMLVISILTAFMIITVFLPAFSLNGKTVEKMTKKIPGGDLLAAMSEEDYASQFEEEIKEYEQETGVKISSISPFKIMTKSLEKLLAGNHPEATEELKENTMFSAIQKKYNLLRILLWIVYGLAFAVVLITLLGYFLQWNKKISLILSSVYGLLAAFLFGYLRFGLMRSIAKAAGSGLESVIGSEAGDITTSIISKVLSCFYSVSFLLAFITAILILIMSIVSILTGNRTLVDDTDIYTIPPTIADLNDNPGEITGFNPFPEIPKTEKVNFEPQPPQPKAAPAMGQVKCIKGVALNSGYRLPQDRKVIVGKSPQNATLVINNQNISNIHCSIRYNAGSNTYLVKDHSLNGTFVNGNRLPKDISMEYPAGTILSLADGSNEIKLG